MVETPVLRVNDRIVLRPATSAVLVAMFEAYQEDAEAAQTALAVARPERRCSSPTQGHALRHRGAKRERTVSIFGPFTTPIGGFHGLGRPW